MRVCEVLAGLLLLFLIVDLLVTARSYVCGFISLSELFLGGGGWWRSDGSDGRTDSETLKRQCMGPEEPSMFMLHCSILAQTIDSLKAPCTQLLLLLLSHAPPNTVVCYARLDVVGVCVALFA